MENRELALRKQKEPIMRTLTQLTKGETAEVRRRLLEHRASQLSSMTPAAWEALEALFERDIAEANDLATLPGEPQREHFGGAERALRDLWQMLSEFKSGEWRHWPEFAEAKKKVEEED
jgi:hypothetical protein